MRGDLLILLSDGIVILCIARCLLQWAGLDANHPLARFCIQATDWLVKPIRKLVPPQGKWDVACILAGLLFYYAVFILIRLTASSEGFGGSDCRKFYIRRIGTDEGSCLCFIHRIVCPHGIKH